jgi:hypothetical protein
MWIWMHKKNRDRRNAPSLSEGFRDELPGPPSDIAQMVADAVTQYNRRVPLVWRFERRYGNERLMKEADEEDTKVFLDGILDIMQRSNSPIDFLR